MPGSLGFPAGRAPGFDPRHIAAGHRPRLSAVATGRSFVNLLTGMPGTPVNTPTAVGNRVLGIATKFVAASSQEVDFAAQSTTNDLTLTLAAICNIDGANAGGICSNTSNGQGSVLYSNSLTFTLLFGGIAFNQSAITLVNGHPYFLAISFSTTANSVNFIALNLRTNVMATDVVSLAGATPAAVDGTFVIGNGKSGATNHYADASIAAVMFSAQYMSMSALRQWASDPWSFWYPPRVSYAIAAQAAGGAFPWWAVRNNDFVIGAGVQ